MLVFGGVYKFTQTVIYIGGVPTKSCLNPPENPDPQNGVILRTPANTPAIYTGSNTPFQVVRVLGDSQGTSFLS